MPRERRPLSQRSGPDGGRDRIFDLPVAEDVERELRSHLEMRTEELVAEGWDRGAARAEAVRLFGDVGGVSAQCRQIAGRHARSQRRSGQMDAISQDVRYALRTLGRSKGFAATAVLTLALGIGANTAVFSVVNETLLQPLPYPAADDLVQVWEVGDHGGSIPVSYRNFADWRDQARSFEALAAYGSGTTTVLGGRDPVLAGVTAVSLDFFRTMQVQPAVGRWFTPDEARQGGQPAAVVSHSFWETQLGGETDLARLSLQIGGMTHPVVGVMPAGFDFPSRTDVWATFEVIPQTPHRTAHNWRVIGRLADGASITRAREEMSTLTARIFQEFPDNDAVSARVNRLQDQLAAPLRAPLLLLLGAAGLVLLVACSNIASTLLARGAAREREIAVRSALGAERLRIVRQLFTESVVLSAAGGVLGVILAGGLVSTLAAVAPASMTGVEDVSVDGWALFFALAASLVTAILFGLFPALQTTSLSVQDGLREGSRGNAGGGRGRLWNLLVGSEVAVSLMLLIGAGLLIRSFWTVLNVDAGFRAAEVVTMDLALQGERYDLKLQEAFQANDPSIHVDEPVVRFYDQLLDAIARIPGVQAVAVADVIPLGGGGSNGLFQMEGGSFEEGGDAFYRAVSRDYLEVLGIPLLRGRSFEERDGPGAPGVILVNQALVDRYYPDTDPIGRRIRTGGMDAHGMDWVEIVGVVANVREFGLSNPPRPTYYVHVRQRADRVSDATVLVRGTAGSFDAIVPAAREAVRRLDPEIPVDFQAMSERISDSVAARRFTVLILSSFAAVALLLTGIGIYGVVSYAVAQRTREMGIRLAIGAEPGKVLGMVVGSSLRTVLVGGALGLAGAVALTRLLRNFLFEVSPLDAPTYAIVVLILLSVAGFASYIPARRATRIDPMIALRAE